MFYSGTALLWAHFLWLNAWIESCVAASLIINWPCWYLHHRGGLTSACSRLHTSNPLSVGYKSTVLACQKNQVLSFWKDSETELLLIGCNVDAGQDNRIWRLIRKRGLFSTNTVWKISLSLIDELYTVMTLAAMMENETESNSSYYIFHYTKQQHTKKCWAVWTRGEGSCRTYHLLRLYNDLYRIYNTATIMITIRHLEKNKENMVKLI